MAGDLTGKVALITGATDGLGRAIAVALAQRGATVLVHGRNRARGEAVLAEVKAAGCPDAASAGGTLPMGSSRRRLLILDPLKRGELDGFEGRHGPRR
jgi:NAD(P)-dependent dehydrogenase (short-subunit alcohol dehydrogenase family)